MMTLRVRPAWLVAGLILLGLAAAAWEGWHVVRRRREQALVGQVETALGELRRGPAALDLRPLLERLEQEGKWKEEHRLLTGADRLRRGDVEGALLFLSAIEPQGPRRLPHQLLLGEALYQAGRMAEADPLFARLLLEFPNEADVHRWVATILYDKGELNPAMGALDRASQLAPDDFLPHQLMALTYVQDFRQYDDAIRHYRLGLERNPPEGLRHDMQRELAQCLVFQKEFAEALDLVRQLPTSPRQQLVRIEALRGLGETDEARSVWNQLEQTAPKLEGVALMGALLDLDQGLAANARVRLQRVLAQRPHNVVARNQMVRACQMLGETDQAKAEAEKLLASQALNERHDRLAAKALAEPGNTSLRRELAQLCDELGRPADAARWRRGGGPMRPR
ncbi:MAG: tetratricopeptide repeat protein [Planctomycetaceae bacterium]